MLILRRLTYDEIRGRKIIHKILKNAYLVCGKTKLVKQQTEITKNHNRELFNEQQKCPALIDQPGVGTLWDLEHALAPRCHIRAALAR